MVTFRENGFVIEVTTGSTPIETWMATHDQLLALLGDVDNDMRDGNYYYVIELLREMMPDWETAKKMIK